LTCHKAGVIAIMISPQKVVFVLLAVLFPPLKVVSVPASSVPEHYKPALPM